jgi:hypothetical protein
MEADLKLKLEQLHQRVDSLKEQIIRDSYLKLTESKNKIRNNLLLLPIEFDFIKTIIWS